MSTVKEIVEAIGKLSTEERVEIKTWVEKNVAVSSPTPADDVDFEKAADRVFEHYAPALAKLAE